MGLDDLLLFVQLLKPVAKFFGQIFGYFRATLKIGKIFNFLVKNRKGKRQRTHFDRAATI